MNYGDKNKLKKAVWQFLIDHSKIQPNGYLGFLFYVRDEKDLWRRIKYRQLTGFQRYDPELKKKNQVSTKKVHDYYRWHKRRAEVINERTQEILGHGSLLEKLKWRLYKRLKKSLFKSIENKIKRS